MVLSQETLRPLSIVMLTADRQIDRRILLEADALESVGYIVKIIGMPLDNGYVDSDPRVVRIGRRGDLSTQQNTFADVYRLMRAALPKKNILVSRLKSFIWRYLVKSEKFFLSAFLTEVLPFQPHILVAHDLPMLPIARAIADKLGAKLVYDSHELFCEQEFSEKEKNEWARVEARHISICDAVITVNASIASELSRRYPLKNVNVIHNAERSSALPVKTRRLHEIFNIGVNGKILLLQGGLSTGRNLEALVEAMTYVRNPLIHLVILGEGPLAQLLQRATTQNGLINKVHFHPHVSQQELLTFTESAEAGVIPYQATCLNNYYCTPNKLFEFIAAGVPILSSDLPELRKFVVGHNIGLVGNMSDAYSIANLIDEFFMDTKRATTWRENILEVRKKICWEEESKALINIFQTLK